ncbi:MULTISPECIES: PilZ domain-containing protein [Bradyrhizobium]|uniref:PilZ domain-containing protein n=1 Tax=Bradyrhizobium TaxID=374 RepID=UPI0009E6D40B|nr:MULTISPECIES: PilZ domain-containing protein [Bradyrhizobium]MBT1516551.1 PilZ domain-containing protein [Bradyrhizobium sp. SRL28]MDE5457593.1 PilZ domain-containing protein [Bradyrhizobium sp. CSA112]WOH52641.1 PilZ domain-containing protein [Bradyrhizobium sp. sBnM-33]
MNRDKRKAKRIQFEHEYRATLLGADGTWRRDCVLVDVSETGACLRIDGSTDVLRSRQFFLLLSKTGLAFRRCELVRLNGQEVGVQFVTSRTIRTRPTLRAMYPTSASD